MSGSLTTFLAALLKLGAVMLVFNEVRGLVLAAPVLYGIYQAGGSLTALWLGICSLGGIALSVAVPMYGAARLRNMALARSA